MEDATNIESTQNQQGHWEAYIYLSAESLPEILLTLLNHRNWFSCMEAS